MVCPLCSHSDARPAWLDRIVSHGRTFGYLECLSCRSLYCEPMPDSDTLARMYGPAYAQSFVDEPSVCDPKQPSRVVRWLEENAPGTFIDYGCGSGSLLAEAIRLKWRAVGVEFDAEVARAVSAETGARVVSCAEIASLGDCQADMLNLGDVIEHLTELSRQMPEILRLIKPGGLLLAQGPLEANANLFTIALRLSRFLRKPRQSEMAPYHVLLATARGQRQFFPRHGLEELEYSVDEVDWPAPHRLTLADFFRPRAVGLFVLRRVSRSVSALRPGRWGNRYFYAGRWNGSP